MAVTTTTQVSSAVNNFYDRVLLSRAVPLFLYARFGQVRDIPKGNSAVIKFRRYGALSAATTALTEGTTPAGSQLSVTDVTATVAQYGDYVTVTDFLQITTLDPLLTETAEVLGEQAGTSLDQICRDVLVAGTTVAYQGGVSARASLAAGMILDAEGVRKMVRTLEGNDAKPVTAQVNPSTGFNTSPIRPSFLAIISDDTHFDLKSDPEWVPVEEYAQSGAPLEGEVGKIDNVRFLNATSNAKTFSSTITVHGTLVIGKEAYGIARISGESLRLINKPIGSAGSEDPLEQRGTVGWKATFVSVILNQNFIGRIEHAVSS